MAESPYKVVVEALAAQSIAIGRLAKEIKVEFAQYQDAQAANDTARAERIAQAINARTEKLAAAADQLAQSYPDAVVGGGPAEDPTYPSGGPVRPGRPTDPDYGIGSERPDTGPVRPGRPTDPDYGIDQGGRPVAPDQPPGRPNRPDQGLPPGGSVDNDLPGGGRPDNSLPGGGRPDNTLPGQGGRPDNSLPGGGNVDNDLPNAPARPDQGQPEGGTKPTPPGQGGTGEIDNTLPETPSTKPTPPGQGGTGDVDNTLPEEGDEGPTPEQRRRSPKG